MLNKHRINCPKVLTAAGSIFLAGRESFLSEDINGYTIDSAYLISSYDVPNMAQSKLLEKAEEFTAQTKAQQ